MAPEATGGASRPELPPGRARPRSSVAESGRCPAQAVRASPDRRLLRPGSVDRIACAYLAAPLSRGPLDAHLGRLRHRSPERPFADRVARVAPPAGGGDHRFHYRDAPHVRWVVRRDYRLRAPQI